MEKQTKKQKLEKLKTKMDEERTVRALKRREAKQHSTREAKDVVTPGSLSVNTRKSHPQFFFSPQRHGARPKVWPRRAAYMPCEKCDRVLTDTGSQAVVCYRTEETKVYLRCRVCCGRYTMGREKRK